MHNMENAKDPGGAKEEEEGKSSSAQDLEEICNAPAEKAVKT